MNDERRGSPRQLLTTAAMGCLLLGSILLRWPLSPFDAALLIMVSVFIGISGHKGLLEYRGQMAHPSLTPEQQLRIQKNKALFMMVLVVIVAAWVLRMVMRR